MPLCIIKEIRFYKSLKYNFMLEIQFDCVASAVADLYTKMKKSKLFGALSPKIKHS